MQSAEDQRAESAKHGEAEAAVFGYAMMVSYLAGYYVSAPKCDLLPTQQQIYLGVEGHAAVREQCFTCLRVA